VTDEWEAGDDSPIQPLTEDGVLKNHCVTFVGKLGGVSRREAAVLVRLLGVSSSDSLDDSVTLVVIGAEEPPLADDGLLSPLLRERAARGDLEVIHETEFWQRLGMVDNEQAVRRLYTPAMLADLIHVPVNIIRRWHRRGLIIPARTVHKLPYFDFTEVATARRLAELVAAGATPESIERRLEELAEFLPDVARPLAQLSVLIEGKQILLRQGEGLIEPGGQLRIDFDSLDAIEQHADALPAPALIPFSAHASRDARTDFEIPELTNLDGEDDPLMQEAYLAEDSGELELAVDYYHAILARDGARADICFQLGELLYRIGQTDAARERYYMAIELDESMVEARASLGCVLAESGRLELAVAAFQGTLSMHDEYPDVHYNLARTLDELNRSEEAEPHWRRFLQLSPDSPWAQEANERLGYH
jgi:tetratricopeptide (TPR) repeat protein